MASLRAFSLLMSTLNNINIFLVSDFLGEILQSLFFFFLLIRLPDKHITNQPMNQILDGSYFLLTLFKFISYGTLCSTAKFLYYLKEEKHQ
uniref:Uncharacterized protein n=1 Tax=Mus musculus TaxID=10090 RepID=Q3V179_MOUSE|nr:unnamed protein product [Mus musculus]